jgi:hypothetical protein
MGYPGVVTLQPAKLGEDIGEVRPRRQLDQRLPTLTVSVPSASPCARPKSVLRDYGRFPDGWITYGRLLDRDRVILGVLMDSFGGD